MTNPIKEKIAALLRRAASTDHHAEAEASMKLAHKLLEKHQLDMDEIELSDDPKSVDPLGIKETRRFEYGTPAAEKYELEATVAQYFGCRVLRFRQGKECIFRIYGTESSRTTHDAMFPYIWKQVLARAKDIAPSGCSRSESQRIKRDVSRALASRLWNLIAQRNLDRQEAAALSDSRALVLLDRDQQVHDWVDSLFDEIGEAKARKLKGPSKAAREAAAKISLARQVETEEDEELKPIAEVKRIAN